MFGYEDMLILLFSHVGHIIAEENKAWLIYCQADILYLSLITLGI